MQNAANMANDHQRYMYDQNRKDQEPWMNVGRNALKQMYDGTLYNNFKMSDFQKDPGYQFRMDEGVRALENSAAAKGSLNSGATLRALTEFGQNLASNEYNNAYNRFNADRDQRYNKLANLAGAGQTATSNVGAAGQAYSSNYGSNLMAGQQARSAGRIGQWNDINQGFQQTQNTLMQGAGGMMAFCDERLKTNITDISKADFQELSRAIQPSIFNYISNEYGEGDYAGVMAQDLEKSKLGRMIVDENEKGEKVIDLKKAILLLLANMGAQNV